MPLHGCYRSFGWNVQLLKVNGRFNSAVGLIAACREAEVPIVFFGSSEKT